QAGSWYHQSKVHDSHNVEMACRLWKLCATDVMQGIVYGSRIPSMGDDPVLATRFDCDQVFGTAVNRFCAQAVAGGSVSPYGSGGQRRCFLALRDAIQCMTIAIEHPPARGEYRVFNQFESVHSIQEVAQLVQGVAREMGLEPEVEAVDNPRIEMEEHRYEV